MPTSNGIISAPITTTDVANTLSSSSRDVGTLCINSNINKWARHKPVRYATTSGITDEQLKAVGFGLEVPTYVTNWENALSQTYNYLRPRGGASEPYRLGDFRNYSHNVPAPCGKLPDITVRVYDLSVVNLTLNVQYLGGDAYNIGLFELNPDLQNWYVACIVTYTRNGADSVAVYKTADKPISSVAYTVAFEDYISDSMHDIHYHFLLTDKQQTTPTSAINGNKFINLPFDNVSDNDGTIKIDTTSPIKFVTKGASNNLASYDNYIPTADVSYAGGQIWLATQAGLIYMQVQLTNESTKTVSMLQNDIQGRVTPSFNREQWTNHNNTFQGTTGWVPMNSIYRWNGSKWEEATSISLGPNETQEYRIGRTNWLACYDGQITYYTESGNYFPGSVEITYDPTGVGYPIGGASPVRIGVI